MTQPDDRELEQYLKGESPLSRRYRDAGGETTPPDLDEAVLARAKAELRRKPDPIGGLNRLLAPFAVAASLVLGVNLAWNVWQAAPQPGEAPVLAEKKARDDAFVPEPPPAAAAPQPAPQAKARQAPQAAPAEPSRDKERDAALAARQEQESRERMAKAEEGATLEREQSAAQRRENFAAQESAPASAGAAAPSAPVDMARAAALADERAPMSEAARIDHLINHVANLAGATFIRNGKEYGPTEAAKHLQYKREKAGDKVKTAEDFIRLCASQSYVSGDAYLIRFADGRTRTAEDVLRDELARIGR